MATLTGTVRSNWLQCKAENSKQLAAATRKPKVLFLEYYFSSYPSSGTFKGWSVEPCHKCDDGSMPVLTNDFHCASVWLLASDHGLSCVYGDQSLAGGPLGWRWSHGWRPVRLY